MRLYLNTTNNLKTIIRINDEEFIFTYDSPRQQNVFGAIERSFYKINKSISDCSEIMVETGPGSFTGLRAGISIANTLSFALNIPINNQLPGTVILPEYGQPPSITKPK